MAPETDGGRRRGDCVAVSYLGAEERPELSNLSQVLLMLSRGDAFARC